MVDVYADIVATLAFVIAASTAGWQVYRHVRWDAPILTVIGMFGYSTETLSSGVATSKNWGFTISVVNTGETPTQILDAYWELELSDGRRARVRGTDAADGSIHMETLGFALIMQGEMRPQVPRTLGKFDSIEWEFMRDAKGHPLIAQATKGRPVVVYVSRKTREDPNGGNPHSTLAAGDWRSMDPEALESGMTRGSKAAAPLSK